MLWTTSRNWETLNLAHRPSATRQCCIPAVSAIAVISDCLRTRSALGSRRCGISQPCRYIYFSITTLLALVHTFASPAITMSSNSPQLAKNMRATTEGFLYAWNGDWTSETRRTSLSYRAPQCQHIMRPATVATPPRSNEEWGEYFTHIEGRIFDGKVWSICIHGFVRLSSTLETDRTSLPRWSSLTTLPTSRAAAPWRTRL